MSERIAKVIARAGICSRRKAEQLITSGHVAIDGKTINTPAINVTPENKISIDGKPLSPPEKTRLWLFHKPQGCITTQQDPQNRTTVFELLPKNLPHTISIGRLDYNTEGLLLLTNNGALAHHLENPQTGWKRHYRTRAFGTINLSKLEQLKQGICLKDIKYAPIEITIDKNLKNNHWLSITLTEGKNREIRKLLEYADLTVNRLIRTSFGPFQLGTLKPEQTKEVPSKVIKEQTGF